MKPHYTAMVLLTLPIVDCRNLWIDLSHSHVDDNSACQTSLQLKEIVESRFHIPINQQRLVTNGGFLLQDDALVQNDATIHVLLPLVGGKGGFGQNLRAMGGKMAKRKVTNKSSCRDLEGRRLKTIMDAKKQEEEAVARAEYEKKKAENRDKKIKEGLQEPEPKKILFDDAEYLGAHEKTKEDVKDAVKQVLSKPKVAVAPAKPKKKGGLGMDDDSDDE